MATDTDAEPSPNQQLIRSFSDEISDKMPGDTLSRGLAAKIAVDEHRRLEALRDQWNLFLLEGREIAIQSVPDEEALLLSQSRKLYEAWTKFCKQLPKYQRQEMAGGIPSLKYLLQSVDKASKTWQEKREGTKTGRLKEVFANLCDNFKDHKTLLSVIPRDDKYVCLLTGSLSAIAQAATNHQEIASGVANSLEELSEDIAYWNSLIAQYGHVDAVHRYIYELYTVVFEFLTEIFLSWSSSGWKRFLKSFDDRAFDKLFNQRQGRIRAIEHQMRRLMTLEFEKRMTAKVNILQTEFQKMDDLKTSQLDHNNLLVALGDDMHRLFDQYLGQQTVQMAKTVDSSTQPMLLESTESLRSSSLNDEARGDKGEAAEAMLLPDDNPTVPPDVHYRREKMLNVLEFSKAEIGKKAEALRNMTSRASRIMIDFEVRKRVTDWNKDPKSCSLWIQGPYDVSSSPSQNTLTAACLVVLSVKSDIPCIFHFCSLDHHVFKASSVSYHRRGLYDMIKSLTIQSIRLTPASFTTRLDFSSQRLEKLQQDNLSVDEALELLQDVWTLVPPYVHCVVDGLQNVEDRGDMEHSRNLLRTLKVLTSKDGKREDSSHTMKFCVTTDGYVDAMAKLAVQGCVGSVAYMDEGDLDEALDVGETVELMAD